jgi:rsbT antagonist protein RsbS
VGRVPIIRVSNTLIASIQDEIRDSEALDLQSDLTMYLERTGSPGVLIDLSLVQTLDSFLGRLLNDVARQCRLLGARTVVVGMQPAVAITLVELGLELRGIQTALNVEKGMVMLQRLLRQEGRDGSHRAR